MKSYRFVHLNVHSHYSINDGCANIKELVDAAIKDRMPGIAITDNGNMFGVMELFDYVCRINNERRQKAKPTNALLQPSSFGSSTITTSYIARMAPSAWLTTPSLP